jgi:hypothetical protein
MEFNYYFDKNRIDKRIEKLTLLNGATYAKGTEDNIIFMRIVFADIGGGFVQIHPVNEIFEESPRYVGEDVIAEIELYTGETIRYEYDRDNLRHCDVFLYSDGCR